jgi:fatty acid desaturase
MTRIPDPAEPVPSLAIPTFLLLLAGIGLWVGSSALYLADVLPWWAAVPLNAIASYLLFTVSHDAAHHSVSSNGALNKWIGRLATPFFAPQAGFQTWRFIHMQHHRFTNHDDGSDPDAYTMRGPAWQRPFRWATVDVYYMVFYLPKLASRPRAEKVELVSQWAIVGAIAIAAAATGHIVDFLVLLVLPCRVAIVYLAWAFDYLPHHGLHLKPTEDKLKATRNRVGSERLLSPVLLYQNYHLVHHLHPLVPFYRYIAVWRRNEESYLDGDPALSTVRGRPLTAEEYRRLRALAEHH